MKKPIYILGINESHCATASLLKNGEIIAVASEERFTEVKNQSGFPKNAVNFCLEFAKIKSKDLDSVDLSFLHPVGFMINQKDTDYKFLSGLSNSIQNLFYNFPKFALTIFHIREFIFNKVFLKNFQRKHIANLSKILHVKKELIHFRDHQTTHAYSAYYSAFNKNVSEKSLTITCDGAGDFVCSRIFTVENNNWKEIASTPNENSIGMLYFYITKYLGMKPNEHEYKVMGLAPYLDQKYSKEILELFKNIYKVKGLTIKSKIPHVTLEKFLEKKLKGKRFDAIASASQLLTEEILKNLIENVIKETGIKNIYLGGGVFMNVKANMLLGNLPEVNKIFIMPSASDESTAIGASYFGYHKYCLENNLKFKPKHLDNIYLGPNLSKKEIKNVLNKKEFIIKKIKNPAKEIAKLISNGEIVARCFGRMEFGQRALGNRSILARADNRDVIKIINEKIKGRDFWMPFAPVILKDRVDDYLVNTKNLDSPYMMMAFETKKLAQKELIAGLHAYDLTTRPQIISEKENKEYYKIVKEFEKLTGIGGLLNTSFNLHGSPIVNTPEDAILTFKNSGLKYLILDNYLIQKI